MDIKMKLQELIDRAEQDPAFRAELASMLAAEDFEDSIRVCREAMRDASEPEIRQQAAALLLKILRRTQNIGWQ